MSTMQDALVAAYRADVAYLDINTTGGLPLTGSALSSALRTAPTPALRTPITETELLAISDQYDLVAKSPSNLIGISSVLVPQAQFGRAAR